MACLVPDKSKKDDGKPGKKGKTKTLQPNMDCPLVQSVVNDVAAEVKKRVLRRLKRRA
jgi:hypothetical protein